tara:strand:+ start:373 stop:1131 length:759 start_codon:yes stop_codon:yes gene_type:complete
MNKSDNEKKFIAQDNLYNFPYHYLPEMIGQKIIKPFRVHFWLYDYLLLHQFLKEKLKDFNKVNILDFGCGDGKLINGLNNSGKNNLYGYEISKRAMAFFKAFNPEVQLINDDKDINQYYNFFDVIIFSEVIEHIADNEVNNVIEKIYKLLKNNGLLLVTAPHENLPVHKKHFRHYNFQKLINNFDISKFEIVEKKFLFKSSILKVFIRKIFFNRFFIINSNFLFNLYYQLNKMYFFSEEKNCENIFLILKKK